MSSNHGVTWTCSSVDGPITYPSVSASATGQYLIMIHSNYAELGNRATGYPQAYISSNYGTSFTALALPTIEGLMWTSAALSSTGLYQWVSGTHGQYLSDDFGVSWKRVYAGRASSGVSLSSTGQYQLMCQQGGNRCHLSDNFGTNWTDLGAIYKLPQTPNWAIGRGVGMSATGQYQIAAMHGWPGEIHVSASFGASWRQLPSPIQIARWAAVGVSSTGQYQVAAQLNQASFPSQWWTGPGDITGPGWIWQSADFGATWSAADVPAAYWQSVSVSSSGKYMMAAAESLQSGDLGKIYVSSNYGVLWTPADGASYTCNGAGASTLPQAAWWAVSVSDP